MTAQVLNGQTTWSVNRTKENHKEYTIIFLVKADPLDGPHTILNAPGLPLTGSTWNFDNDFDPWAFCLPTTKCTPILTGKPNRIWQVEKTFSTDIPSRRCQDTEIEDPLLEPMKVRGTFNRTRREATKDLNGDFLVSSSWERISGPLVEHDVSYPAVMIEQNVVDLQLSLVTNLIHHVNNHALWGLPARTVKFSEFSWERKIFGSCYYYYTRSMVFETDPEGWDREVPDEGTLFLRGEWQEGVWTLLGGPDPDDPRDFVRAVDQYENILPKAFLNGSGQPASEPFVKTLQIYPGDNLFALGIPTTL